jgi:hypothetical protein
MKIAAVKTRAIDMSAENRGAEIGLDFEREAIWLSEREGKLIAKNEENRSKHLITNTLFAFSNNSTPILNSFRLEEN